MVDIHTHTQAARCRAGRKYVVGLLSSPALPCPCLCAPKHFSAACCSVLSGHKRCKDLRRPMRTAAATMRIDSAGP